MVPKLVKFKCCGDTRLFTYPGEFHMCKCESSGYDAGNSFYSRILGKPGDVEVVSMFNEQCQKDLEKRKIPFYLNMDDKVVALINCNIEIICEQEGRFMLEAYGDDPVAYCSLKSALSKARKLLKERE